MSNEALWAGDFGREYTERNALSPYELRKPFFKAILDDYIIKSVLEVGCNMGFNLALMQGLAPKNIWGCDVNDSNIQRMREQYPLIQSVVASGFDLPFRDGYFDLVFTSGVLIHQKPTEVEAMMQEIIRVSGKYVMAIEYWSETFKEIKYRGGDETLFKGPFGDVYEKRYGMRTVASGSLDRNEGWDDCQWWLLKVT